MKFCSKCGKEIMDEAVVCIHCGCQVAPTDTSASKKSISPNSNPTRKVVGTIIGIAAIVIALGAIIFGIVYAIGLTA